MLPSAVGLDVLAGLELIRINDCILTAAGALLPEELRTLDAIHVATAGLEHAPVEVGVIERCADFDRCRRASRRRNATTFRPIRYTSDQSNQDPPPADCTNGRNYRARPCEEPRMSLRTLRAAVIPARRSQILGD